MPCRCDGYETKTWKKELDELTRDMCYLTANLAANGILEEYASPRILAWHEEHKRDDEIRVRDAMRKHYKEHPEQALTPDKVAERYIDAAEAVHPVSDWHRKWFYKLSNEERSAGLRILERRKLKERALKKLSAEELEALAISAEE